MPLLTMSSQQENPEFYHSDASQEGKILEYLKQGYPLTGLQGLRLFGTMRLGARVFQLRKEGWDIRSDWIKVGTKKSVKRYFLAKS